MRKKMWMLLALLTVMLSAGVFPAQAADTLEIQGYTKSKGYDYVTFGQYPTEEDGTVAPILWRVLESENGEAYLMSEYILFASPIHADYQHYTTWESSDLYVYLNSEFKQEAFSDSEQAVLLQRTEDNALVTLPHIEDMRNADYGFSTNNDRYRCEGTPWAKRERTPKKLTLMRYSPLYKYSPWWSRTVSENNPLQHRDTKQDGVLGRLSVGNPDVGVRPVVYVDLSRLAILGGSGVKDDPWQLQPSDASMPVEPTEAPQETAAPAATDEPIADMTDAPTPVPETTTLPVTDAPTTEPTVEPPVLTATPVLATVNPDLVNVLPMTISTIVPSIDPDYYAQTPVPTAAPTAEPVAVPSASPEETAEETEAPVQSAAPTQEPEQTLAPLPTETIAPTETHVQPAGYTAAALPELIHEKFPALDEKGFLPEGEPEFVLKDEENGLWLYASHTLRIEINRRTGTNSKNEPLRWYEAQVFTRNSDERFDLYPWDETKYTNINVQELADKIAKKHHLVFGINSDYFIYRLERDREESYNYPLGIEIRDGQVLAAWPRNALSTVYPPLDTMAFYPDGSIRLFKNDQLYTPEFADYLKRQGREDYKALAERLVQEGVTPEQLLADGVTDTLSFGPILVENGQVSPRSKEFGNTPNPRTAFGMVEPGYYICVMVESRITESKGESCVWLGEKMAELGCTSAFNLDGGATSTMIFMGEQINKSGNYGDITNRKQNELLGIGYSDAVN